jgi:hypothetical protein
MPGFGRADCKDWCTARGKLGVKIRRAPLTPPCATGGGCTKGLRSGACGGGGAGGLQELGGVILRIAVAKDGVAGNE